jgi:hypothetical protein
MIDGLQHTEGDNECSVCEINFSDDEGGMLGYIGIIPVAFCPTCYAGICDMVEQLDGREWEGLTDEEIEGAIDDGFAFGLDDGNVSNQAVIRYVRVIEAKIKEKNSYE